MTVGRPEHCLDSINALPSLLPPALYTPTRSYHEGTSTFFAMPPLESVKLNKIDDVLANAASALAIASDFGSILPIPIVVTVIGSAQLIIQTAQVRAVALIASMAWELI